MAEELGFKTPAKELEKLQKRLEEMEGLGTVSIDALKLSIGALIEIFTDRVLQNPKDARKEKDRLLEKIKEVGVSPLLVDTLDDNFKARCDLVDEAFRRKRR